MIRYDLRCVQGHVFDSWFQSGGAFDALQKAGHLSCAQCGSPDVSKTVMAPGVATSKQAEAPIAVLKEPTSDVEKAIAELRRKVEATADYVGTDFTREARAMHLGDAPERSIYGEARPDQARALIEDGVPLMPLPFRPKRKSS